MYEKKYLIVVFLFSFTFVQAQVNKDNWMVGGTANFSSGTSSSTEEQLAPMITNTTNLGLSSSVGYFIIDNLSLGLKLDMSYLKSNTINGAYSRSFRSGIGPFTRYYFLPSENQINLFAEDIDLEGIENMKNQPLLKLLLIRSFN